MFEDPLRKLNSPILDQPIPTVIFIKLPPLCPKCGNKNTKFSTTPFLESCSCLLVCAACDFPHTLIMTVESVEEAQVLSRVAP